jgi:hypothetical protein
MTKQNRKHKTQNTKHKQTQIPAYVRVVILLFFSSFFQLQLLIGRAAVAVSWLECHYVTTIMASFTECHYIQMSDKGQIARPLQSEEYETGTQASSVLVLGDMSGWVFQISRASSFLNLNLLLSS